MIRSWMPFYDEGGYKSSIAIFGNTKRLPIYGASGLRREVTMSLNYDFAIEYFNTKDFASEPATLPHCLAARGARRLCDRFHRCRDHR